MIDSKHLKIMGSVRKIWEARRTIKNLKDVVEKESLLISNYMFSTLPNGVNTFNIRVDEGGYFYSNPTDMKVNRIRKKTFVWDFKKLEQQIKKKTLSKFVQKTCIISDYEGLVKYLKSCGVDPIKFKSFLSVEQSIDLKKLDDMLEIGEVKREDIEGCYTVELGNPYIKIVENKDQKT